MKTDKANILIIGAGEVGTALLILLSNSDSMSVIGVADKDKNAPGMKLAREKDIPTAADWRVFLGKKEIQHIINTTASVDIQKEIDGAKPDASETAGINKRSFVWSVINESIRAQEKLFEREEQYKRLFDNAADLIAVVDTMGRFTDLNRRFEEESEYSKEEMLGKNVLASGIVTAASAAKIGFYLAKIVMGQDVPIIEVDGVKKSGSIVNYELRAVPVKKDGRITGVQAILRNITERKAIEEKLRQSEVMYRTIFENTGTASLIAREDMTIEMINAEFMRFSGFSKEEAEKRKKLFDFIHAQDADKIREFHWLRKVDPETAPKNYDIRFVDKRGKVSEVIMTAALIPGTGSTVISMQDITELKQNEYQLSKQKELLDNANKALQHKLEELQDAFGHIKRLEGLVPICANCKKLRVTGGDPSDPGAWVPLEKYFSDKTDASFTHGLCPDCIRKLYGSQLGDR